MARTQRVGWIAVVGLTVLGVAAAGLVRPLAASREQAPPRRR